MKWMKVLSLLVIMSIVGACSAQNTSNHLKKDGQTVTIAVIGDKPKDIDAMYQKLDRLTKKEINAIVRFEFISWQDWSNKYNLALTSNKQIDVIVTGDWMNYSQYAERNAFYDLTDLVKKETPTLYQAIDEKTWDNSKINGKLFAVPSTNVEFLNAGIMFREDLRKKYQLPEINSMKTLEQYFFTLMKKENIKTPVLQNLAQGMIGSGFPYISADSQGRSTLAGYGLMVDPNNLSRSVFIYEKPAYHKLITTMKNWASKGIISKNLLNDTQTKEELVKVGQLPADLDSTVAKAGDWAVKTQREVKEAAFDFVPYAHFTDYGGGLIYPTRPHHNMLAITKNSTHPELGLKVIELFHTNQDVYDLVTYGIKDLNYKITKDGKIDTATVDQQHLFSMPSWSWEVEKYRYEKFDEWPLLKQKKEEMKKQAKEDPFAAFVFDATNVQADLAALQQVKAQYIDPLEAGLVPDPDQALEQVITKLNQAGLEKVQKDLDRQLQEYANK
ncbi:ABC transporter substrate-binding protein [Bacillus sp. NPDC077027]|uniref:ABC transporter substrate-binding protein n=1 Tax=Bacillus sp. NPDC077027 TaxID=3390548 RepID=UPI003D061B4F